MEDLTTIGLDKEWQSSDTNNNNNGRVEAELQEPLESTRNSRDKHENGGEEQPEDLDGDSNIEED